MGGCERGCWRCVLAGRRFRESRALDTLATTDSNWVLSWKDYAISIATIHHLSTPERRRNAVQVRILSPFLLLCLTSPPLLDPHPRGQPEPRPNPHLRLGHRTR